MMGMLMGISEEIERLRFVRFPTRPASADKVVRIDKLIVARLSNGEIAVERDMGNFAYPPNNEVFPWMDELVEALRRLGALSKAAAGEHLALCNRNAARQRRKYAVERLNQAATELGISFTAEQHQIIEGAITRKDAGA